MGTQSILIQNDASVGAIGARLVDRDTTTPIHAPGANPESGYPGSQSGLGKIVAMARISGYLGDSGRPTPLSSLERVLAAVVQSTSIDTQKRYNDQPTEGT